MAQHPLGMATLASDHRTDCCPIGGTAGVIAIARPGSLFLACGHITQFPVSGDSIATRFSAACSTLLKTTNLVGTRRNYLRFSALSLFLHFVDRRILSGCALGRPRWGGLLNETISL